MNENEIKILLNKFKLEMTEIKNIENINNLKIKYLGRKGILNEHIKNIKNFSIENRKEYGDLLNNCKKEILNLLEKKKESIKIYNNIDVLDITLPSVGIKLGNKHIISQTIEKLEDFFLDLGFNLVNSDEIDSVYFNFEALNMSRSHPSININETFYISDEILLRTHTSNTQIHTMEKKRPPFKIISHGKVYRRDSDISHTPMFHQLEGFYVDKNVSLIQLKSLLLEFLTFYFNTQLKVRLRPSYFPFTEPSMEVDIGCINCNGLKCAVCKYTGWIEILGCGMIHPKIFYNCNIDYKKYSGFAFGVGIERISMIKHKINDIRIYYDNNIDFLNQF